jgi:glutaredoxin 2
MKLYHYEHCPFCVKARMIFGIKNVPFELIALQNDDEETPTKMIGKKMVPILQKDDGTYMPESMDIVAYVDSNFGDSKAVGQGGNAAIAKWLDDARSVVYKLAMPRWVNSSFDEFRSQSAKDYFTTKKEASLGASFKELFANSKEYIATANELLLQLDKILLPSGKLIDFGKTEFVNGALSEDDIHLFATLRSFSIVEGLEFPSKVKKYVANLSSVSKVPLHFGIAL